MCHPLVRITSEILVRQWLIACWSCARVLPDLFPADPRHFFVLSDDRGHDGSVVVRQVAAVFSKSNSRPEFDPGFFVFCLGQWTRVRWQLGRQLSHRASEVSESRLVERWNGWPSFDVIYICLFAFFSCCALAMWIKSTFLTFFLIKIQCVLLFSLYIIN